MPSNKVFTNDVPFILLSLPLPIPSQHISESTLKEAEEDFAFPFDLLCVTCSERCNLNASEILG